MNYKLEKFWNFKNLIRDYKKITMNYKLEKFWNKFWNGKIYLRVYMNYKLEKFWNSLTPFSAIRAAKDEL